MHKLLHCLVSETAAPARVAQEADTVKLTDSNAIEAYLTAFERMMGTEDRSAGHSYSHLNSLVQRTHTALLGVAPEGQGGWCRRGWGCDVSNGRGGTVACLKFLSIKLESECGELLPG